jgi:DNA polymerase-3 subunit delta
MYKSEFDKLNQLNFNGYLFWGQNDFLVETYAEDSAKKLANGEEVTKVYFEEYNFDKCYDTLSQSSLFSSSNILLIKTNKKIPKKDVDRLLEACSLNSDSKVIFACIGDKDFKSMQSSFSKKTNGVFVRFYPLQDWEAVKFLASKASEQNINIDNHALEFLYTMHQKDLGLSVSDLSKLAILDEVITAKTISIHCFGLGSVNIEDFLEKLLLGGNINKDLYDLLEEGMNEIQLLTKITGFVQTLFMINSYLKLHGQLNIMEIWGYPLPKQIASRQASIATKFKQEDFIYMLNFLQELELELKSGKIINLNSYLQSKLRTFLN